MINEGDKCLTLSYGRVPTSYRYGPTFQPAIYQARRRKRDGVLIWSYYCHWGRVRRSFKLAEIDLQAQAVAAGLPVVVGVRHNDLVKGVQS